MTNNVCSGCQETENEEDTERFHSARIEFILQKELVKSKTASVFGLELETYNPENAYCDNDYINVEEDGSLSNGSYPTEYTTVPTPYPKLKQLIEGFTVWAKETSHAVNTTCGYHLHVNVNKNDVTLNNIKKLWAMYYILEKTFFVMMPKSRQQNRYCLPMRSDYELKKILKKSKLHRLFGYYYAKMIRKPGLELMLHNHQNKYNGKRYYWLNLHSIFVHGTIEIRLHNGTLNKDKILNWVDIHRKLIKWCLKQDSVYDVLNVEEKLKSVVGIKLYDYMMAKAKSKKANALSVPVPVVV